MFPVSDVGEEGIEMVDDLLRYFERGAMSGIEDADSCMGQGFGDPVGVLGWGGFVAG